MSASLVGSEMCIRDRGKVEPSSPRLQAYPAPRPAGWSGQALQDRRRPLSRPPPSSTPKAS
eukprot:3666410-Alexandrium_andersonii.AAC.1